MTAEAAILLCRTVEECDDWDAKNAEVMKALPKAHGAHIWKFFCEHRASLLPLHPNAKTTAAEEVFA